MREMRALQAKGSRTGAVALLAASACLLSGCFVQVHKNGDGEEKDVSIGTPFGGVRVNKQGGKPVDTGLPVYPGSVAEKKLSGHGDDDGGSADVHVGFGEWQLRVQVASYISQDAQPKVQDFYTKALATYGTVLVCKGHKAIGAATRTGEGLTCADDDDKHHVVSDADIELKAGSKRHQHIVAFGDQKTGGTHYVLLNLTLPESDDDHGTPQ